MHSSLGRQVAPQQTAKFRTARFRQFCRTLRKDGVANYRFIHTYITKYPLSVRLLYVLYNALTFRSSIGM